MGIEDPSTFDYVTAPSRAALLKALQTLAMLGALDKTGRVTADGKKMAALPLDPAFAHLLVRYDLLLQIRSCSKCPSVLLIAQ